MFLILDIFIKIRKEEKKKDVKAEITILKELEFAE